MKPNLVGQSIRIVGVLAVAWSSSACPLCHTATGQLVRAGIFDDSFGLRTLAIAAPFPVFAAVIVSIYFGGEKRK